MRVAGTFNANTTIKDLKITCKKELQKILQELIFLK